MLQIMPVSIGGSRALQYRECNSQLLEDKRKNEEQIKQVQLQIRAIENEPCSSAQLEAKRQRISVLKGVINDLKKYVNSTKKSSHPVWPQSTSNGQPRTKENVLTIVQKLEENGTSQMSKEEAKGITGRSLLLDLDYFDYVISIPAEYMHTTCLGAVKRWIHIHIFFNLAEVRKKIYLILTLLYKLNDWALRCLECRCSRCCFNADFFPFFPKFQRIFSPPL